MQEIFLEEFDTVPSAFDRDRRRHFVNLIKMKKRGGFFGALWNGIKSIAAPLLGNVGKVVSGIFGGAKKQAAAVAHQAISTVAQGALKTGDVSRSPTAL